LFYLHVYHIHLHLKLLYIIVLKKRKSTVLSQSNSTTTTSTNNKDGGLWETGLIHIEISEEDTRLLLAACKKENATIGCALYAAGMMASSQLMFDAYKNKNRARIWGVMVIDMRGHVLALQHKWAKENPKKDSQLQFNPESLGIFITTMEFMYWFKRVPGFNDTSAFWRTAKELRKDIASAFAYGKQFTSIMACRILTYYAAFFSQRFLSPHPCPAFSLSNLGSLDPPTIGHSPRDGEEAKTSSVAPKDVSAIADKAQELSANFPFLDNIHVGVSTGCSFPVPLITVLTYKGKLRIAFSYPKETMSRAYCEQFVELFLFHLHRGYRSQLGLLNENHSVQEKEKEKNANTNN